jgi:hypothetical protein
VNFKHVLIIVGVLAVVLISWKFFTRLDRSDPIAVANAFTEAMKDQDMKEASSYFPPDQSAAWLEKQQARVDSMKSGATENYFAGIPEAPGYTLPAAGANGSKLLLTSSDKSFTVEMGKIEDEWFVTKAAY